MCNILLLALCWLLYACAFGHRRRKSKQQAKDNPAVHLFCARYQMAYLLIQLLVYGDTTVGFLRQLSYLRRPYVVCELQVEWNNRGDVDRV